MNIQIKKWKATVIIMTMGYMFKKNCVKIIVRKKIEKTKKLSCKVVGEKLSWICREIDFYYFDEHRRYHLNKNLDKKYVSACEQLKKMEIRSEDACINKRSKKKYFDQARF